MLSIIVTNYKDPEYLFDFLPSLEEASEEFEQTEIIVINSAEIESTEEKLKEKYPEVGYRGFSNNVGFTRLVNEGLKRTEGDYIFITNSDIKVKKDALVKMRDYLENNEKVGLVGPKINVPSGDLAASPRRFYSHPWTALARRTPFGRTKLGEKYLDAHLMTDYDREEPREVDWILGEAFFTKRGYIQKVGHLDNRFFLYFTDVDWCFRFWEKDLKVVYCPEAQVGEFEETGEITKTKGRGLFSIFTNPLTRIHAWEYLKFIFKHLSKSNPRKGH